MINLLSKDVRKQIKAGHSNVFLVKVLVMIGAATVVLTLLSIGAFIIINTNNSSTSADSVNDSDYQTAKTKVDEVKQSIADYDNFTSSTMPYSKLLLELAKNIGNDSIIKDFNHSTNTSTDISLTIYSKDVNSKEILNTNFASSNIFTNFNISETKENQTNIAGYPIEHSVTMTVNKEVVK